MNQFNVTIFLVKHAISFSFCLPKKIIAILQLHPAHKIRSLCELSGVTSLHKINFLDLKTNLRDCKKPHTRKNLERILPIIISIPKCYRMAWYQHSESLIHSFTSGSFGITLKPQGRSCHKLHFISTNEGDFFPYKLERLFQFKLC